MQYFQFLQAFQVKKLTDKIQGKKYYFSVNGNLNIYKSYGVQGNESYCSLARLSYVQ